MKIFCQIYNNKAHWIFEAEEKPEFAPDIVIKDITDLEVQPQEGWDYNEETGEFSKPTPVIVPVDLQPQKMLTLEEINQNQLTIMNALADMYMDFMSK